MVRKKDNLICLVSMHLDRNKITLAMLPEALRRLKRAQPVTKKIHFSRPDEGQNCRLGKQTDLIILFAVRVAVLAHVLSVQQGVAGLALEAPDVKLKRS